MEMSNLPDAVFKILAVKMLNELGGSLGELRENFNNIKKDIKVIKEPVRNKQYTNCNEEYITRYQQWSRGSR